MEDGTFYILLNLRLLELLYLSFYQNAYFISEKVNKISRPETRYSSTFWSSIWYFNYKRYKAHTESVNSSVSGKKYIILINCQEKKSCTQREMQYDIFECNHMFFFQSAN